MAGWRRRVALHHPHLDAPHAGYKLQADIAGAQQGATGQHLVAIFCFVYFERTLLIEALREVFREDRRHVLHDDDRGDLRRQRCEQLRDCLRSTRGSASRRHGAPTSVGAEV
jgi:hypothetical protein